MIPNSTRSNANNQFNFQNNYNTQRENPTVSGFKNIPVKKAPANLVSIQNIAPETLAQIVKQHVLPMFQPPKRIPGRKFKSSSESKDFGSV